MMKSIYWTGILILLSFLIGCDHSTSPTDASGTITETDDEGNIVGNFDPDDWVYPDLFFHNLIQINPVSISFRVSEVGETSVDTLTFENKYGHSTATFSFSGLDDPFSMDKNQIKLKPGHSENLEIQFLLEDAASCSDTLVITKDNGESIVLKVAGFWIDPEPSDGAVGNFEIMPTVYTFGPAYPNPAVDSVTIHLTLPKLNHVKITVLDNKHTEIQILSDQKMATGHHRFFWRTDDLMEGVYRILLETEDFTAYGDVRKMN